MIVIFLLLGLFPFIFNVFLTALVWDDEGGIHSFGIAAPSDRSLGCTRSAISHKLQFHRLVPCQALNHSLPKSSVLEFPERFNRLVAVVAKPGGNNSALYSYYSSLNSVINPEEL